MEDIMNAEDVVLNCFEKLLKDRFGLSLSNARKSSCYVLENKPHITMWIDFKGGPSDIRLSLNYNNLLSVGWCANNLLTVNSTEYNDVQVEVVKFVAKILENYKEWVDLLLELDVSPIIKEEEEASVQREAELELARKNKLKAFDDAKIVVGTLILTNYLTEEVLKINSVKIKLGNNFYTREAVGGYLLEGKWKVLN